MFNGNIQKCILISYWNQSIISIVVESILFKKDFEIVTTANAHELILGALTFWDKFG